MTYSPIFKAHFKKILAAAKACLVFIKNRCRSQMSFKIGVLIKLSQYSEKNTWVGVSFEWSCGPSREYCEMFKNSYFYGTTPVAASADVLFYIIFSKKTLLYIEYIVVMHCIINSFWNLKTLVVICCTTLCHWFSLVATRCHSFSFVVTCCYSLYHSLSLFLPLVVTRCHSLSFVVPLVVTRCHSMYPLSFFL